MTSKPRVFEVASILFNGKTAEELKKIRNPYFADDSARSKSFSELFEKLRKSCILSARILSVR